MTPPGKKNRVVVRGAGEMASGVIEQLFRAGWEVIALEQAAPVCVRRTVCFAESVFTGETTIEGMTARLAETEADITPILAAIGIPLIIDPEARTLSRLCPSVVVDGRMLKNDNDCSMDLAPLVIGLGPGFRAGENCHGAVETNRGPELGRVYLTGGPQAYTGIPGPVMGATVERVLRAPVDGVLRSEFRIGEKITRGEIVCVISGVDLASPLDGVVRGLVRDGLVVRRDQKIGDIDPRGDRDRCFHFSRKAKTIGRGTIEAIMTLRAQSAP